MRALVPPGMVTAGASARNAMLAGKVTSAWRGPSKCYSVLLHPPSGHVECLSPTTFTLHQVAATELSHS